MNCVICDQSNLQIVFKHQKWGEDCLQCPDCGHIHLFNYNHTISEKDFGTNIKRADYYLDKISKMQFQNILDIGSPSDFYFLKQILKKTKTFSPKKVEDKNIKDLKNIKGQKNTKGRKNITNKPVPAVVKIPTPVPAVVSIKKAYAYDLFPHSTPDGIIMINDLSLPRIRKMKIDLSMAIHVLEHIPALVPFLFSVKQITRHLIIEVPDCSDIKDAIRSSINPHYNFFTLKSFQTLLETVRITNYTLSIRIHNGKYKMLVAECKIDHPNQYGSMLGINKVIDTGYQTILDLTTEGVPNCKKIIRELFLNKNNVSYYPTNRSAMIRERFYDTEKVINRKNLTQAIELGPGFSPHAINLRHQIKNYIEVDYEKNQQLKSQIIKKLYANMDNHVQYVGGDIFLQETWDKIHAKMIDAPTIIFEEGSLSYWSKEKFLQGLFMDFIAPILKKNPKNIFLASLETNINYPGFVVEEVSPNTLIVYSKEAT